jgi:hypothetical protein
MILLILILILSVILFYSTWRFQKFNEILTLFLKLSELKKEKDDGKQEKLLLYVSKKMMVFSLINFGLLLVWISPFIVCYLTAGPEFFFKLFLSSNSIIITSVISVALYLKFKAI